jgi:hypothetical protein
MVDPWIGPLNALWLVLVTRARRECRLIELDAPPLILDNEAGIVQQALDLVWNATRVPPPVPGPPSRPPLYDDKLVPPLHHAPADLDAHAEREMHRIAVLGPDRFLVQEPERVRIVERGAARELPASGCRLVGILDERYAVFHGYFQATHPYLAADSGFGEDHVRLEDGTTEVGRTCGELSVLDLDGERYLERAPPSLPDRWVQNDEPEDLLLASLDGEHAVRLAVGGDRPGVLAYGRDLAFAWVGEDSDTWIIDVATGIPHCLPTDPERAARRLDLSTGELADGDPDDDDLEDDGGGAAAIAFADGRWWLLWPSGILADHRGAGAVRLVPAPVAAALDAAGARLGCLIGGVLAVVDLAPLAVSRVAL